MSPKSREKIDEIYAFIVEENGVEAIMGFKSQDGWIPMVGADMERVQSLIPIADHVEKISGKKYEIVKFTHREKLP